MQDAKSHEANETSTADSTCSSRGTRTTTPTNTNRRTFTKEERRKWKNAHTVRLHNVSLELLDNFDDSYNDPQRAGQLSGMTLTRTTVSKSEEMFIIAQMNNAPVSRLGIFYEMVKYGRMREHSRFFDKRINDRTCKLSWYESGLFLFATTNLMAMVSSFCTKHLVVPLYNGLLFHTLTAFITVAVASPGHLMLLFVYKYCVRSWIPMQHSKQSIRRNKAMWTIFAIACGMGKFKVSLFEPNHFRPTTFLAIVSFIILHSIKPFFYTKWFQAYLMAMAMFLPCGLIIWYIVALKFGYFDVIEECQAENNREEFMEMIHTKEIINPTYINKTLSNIFSPRRQQQS